MLAYYALRWSARRPSSPWVDSLVYLELLVLHLLLYLHLFPGFLVLHPIHTLNYNVVFQLWTYERALIHFTYRLCLGKYEVLFPGRKGA